MPAALPPSIEFSDLRSSLVRDGFAYWQEKKAGRPFPARTDFDPLVEAPKLAGNIVLVDVRRAPLDFHYRLIGTQIRHNMAANWTGQWMSRIPIQRAPNPIWLHHEWVVENRAPRFFRPAYVGPYKDFKFIESALLPLGADGETVDMMMAFVDFLSMTGNPPNGFRPAKA